MYKYTVNKRIFSPRLGLTEFVKGEVVPESVLKNLPDYIKPTVMEKVVKEIPKPEPVKPHIVTPTPEKKSAKRKAKK